MRNVFIALLGAFLFVATDAQALIDSRGIDIYGNKVGPESLKTVNDFNTINHDYLFGSSFIPDKEDFAK